MRVTRRGLGWSGVGLLLLLQAPDPVRSQTGAPPESLAVVSVVGSEEGLPVFINGRMAGTTPLNDFVVGAGKVEVTVRHSQPESWLDSDWSETYRLEPGDTLLVRARMKRGIVIASTPYGAQVFVDHVLQGTTPMVLFLEEDELASVELRLEGYKMMSAVLDSNSPRLWEIDLKEDVATANARRNGVGEKEADRRRIRRLALISAGISAASGVAAILLKHSADHYYDDYLVAGEPRRLDALYSKTVEYDRYAGVAFSVFEVTFGLSFYWFLRSNTQ